MTSADEDFGSHRRRGNGRREPAHAKASPRWPDGGTGLLAARDTFEDPRFGHQDPRWPDAAPPAYRDPGPAAYQADYYQGEYADWTQPPGNQAEYAEIPRWTPPLPPEYPEYPEWSGQPAYQAEHPGWSDQGGYQGEYSDWAQPPAAQGEYPGQPGPYGQYALHPDHPSWPESQFAPWPGEAPVTDHRPSAVAMAPPLPTRQRPPSTPQPDFPPRPDAQANTLAPRRDLPLHRDMDLYPAPIMQDTITDVANWARQDAGYAQPARERLWEATSSQLADWIIADANQQAAEIFRQARSQASSSLADAQQEAAELVRRTGEQARLTIEAAELEAAEIRATMMKLTTELTGMAAYVAQSLSPAPAAPATPTFAAPTLAPHGPQRHRQLRITPPRRPPYPPPTCGIAR